MDALPNPTTATTATVPTVATKPTTIKLFALMVGRQAFSVTVERTAPIPTLLEALKTCMMRVCMPHEFTAYTARRGGAWLHGRSHEYDAIVHGGWGVAASLCTADTRLDPTKTVADYFGDAPQQDHAHMLLQWTPKAMAQHQANVARWRAQRAHFARLQRQDAAKSSTTEDSSWWTPVARLFTAPADGTTT